MSQPVKRSTVMPPCEDTVAAHYARARAVALVEVERLARGILRRRSHLSEFIMAMGSWGFTTAQGETLGEEALRLSTSRLREGIVYTYAYPAWVSVLADFIDDWDDTLHLTGEPMRCTATGPLVREW